MSGPMTGLVERKWLMIVILPCGLQTRWISRIMRTGSGTTLMTWNAFTKSNASSGKSRCMASMANKRKCRQSFSAARWRARSNMSGARSIPVTVQCGGYAGMDRPVPTPTSSTCAPG